MIHAPETADRPTLVLTRTLPAGPEKVWRAWTEPDKLARWFGPHGMHAEVVDFTLKVGGTYKLRLPAPPDAPEGSPSQYVVLGEYTVIEPVTRLAFTWAWESPGWAGKTSTVTVELEPVECPDGGGTGTLLTLTHADLLDDEAKKSHGEGWNEGLERLADLIRE